MLHHNHHVLERSAVGSTKWKIYFSKCQKPIWEARKLSHSLVPDLYRRAETQQSEFTSMPSFIVWKEARRKHSSFHHFITMTICCIPITSQFMQLISIVKSRGFRPMPYISNFGVIQETIYNLNHLRHSFVSVYFTSPSLLPLLFYKPREHTQSTYR